MAALLTRRGVCAFFDKQAIPFMGSFIHIREHVMTSKHMFERDLLTLVFLMMHPDLEKRPSVKDCLHLCEDVIGNLQTE